MNEPQVFKIQDVADRFNCSERAVLQLIYDGKLTAFKIGNRYRISEQAISDYINQNSTTKKEIENHE